jgi:DNA-directed RNA polymerase subunit beta'
MIKDMQEFDSILIKLASPEQIRKWSYGEVKKSETINYRSQEPEDDGLFCRKIFGTTKDWECKCGKFKSIRYKGVKCERCGVEVTHSRVRRERMGHIELAAPVAHIWYYRSVPSPIGLLLNLSSSDLRSVLYYEKYIVIDAGNEEDTKLHKFQVLTEDEYNKAKDKFGQGFTADTGADAIKILLKELDLQDLAKTLRDEMKKKDGKVDKKHLKRLKIVDDFLKSKINPSWMILDVIPVIPPDLRPMTPMEGGRFATSDLNDLYRRVINRNNRLKKVQAMGAPSILLRSEKRMLQEAVDALLDNSKKKKMAKGTSNRPAKSLSDMLKGKQGRFRQNLLGKRVDYSGRSVIVVGPELKFHQCGLPAKMALELYKPFIMKKLVEKEIVYNIKKAKTLVEEAADEVWSILDEVVKEHPVMLNRAPTLHRLGIQAFEPVLVEGKAIKLHPLVCRAFNADFDGDQMAVHLPLTQAAQIECWTLMMSINNLLDPASGNPIVFPSLDMVLGIYQLTIAKPYEEIVTSNGEKKLKVRCFSSFDEVLQALDSRTIRFQDVIKIKVVDGKVVGKKVDEKLEGQYILTTPGRLLFNEPLPDVLEFHNGPFFDGLAEKKWMLDADDKDKKEWLKGYIDKDLKKIIFDTYKKLGSSVTIQLLDAVKSLGFKYATKFGSTISMADIIVPPEKKERIEKAMERVKDIQSQFNQGKITEKERFENVTNVWSMTSEKLTEDLMKRLEEDRQGFNPVYMMTNSGARGSRTQLRQLAGMRGLMNKPNGDIIELAIRSNFKEGLSIIEFFISCNGARKGLADTALKTSNAGYLTRRLVDIAQDVVVEENDCGTINGMDISALKEGDKVKETLAERIEGRFTLEQVKHPITHELILDMNQEITEAKAKEIEAAGIETVRIRSVLTCDSKHGVCQKCYGWNLANNRPVEIGEAVGIIAAQSIGQPGTQLTMRTFHTGGTADKASEKNEIKRDFPVYVKEIHGNTVLNENGVNIFTRKGYLVVNKILIARDINNIDKLLVEDWEMVTPGKPLFKKGKETVNATNKAYVHVYGDKLLSLGIEQRIDIKSGTELFIKADSCVEADTAMAKFDPFNEPIIAEYSGYVMYHDLNDKTMKEVINAKNGKKEKRIIEFNDEALDPRISIVDENENELVTYYLPGNSYVLVDEFKDNDKKNKKDKKVRVEIKAGTTLAKMDKNMTKATDITGDLPRVEELFEARIPKNPAVLAMVSGTVKFYGKSKGKRNIIITDEQGREFKHLVPMGKNLLVRDGDKVEAGEKLCDGEKNPHDILNILGENALQSYLMNEVLKVYKKVGVRINDKHIGVIIRQMLRKVEIAHVGDTKFILGSQEDKVKFQEENKRVIEAKGAPAVARSKLLGITKASLAIESFLSAASFQETTKVLTNAAIEGKMDHLHGLKENLLIGHLIPAGTGNKMYRNVKLYNKQNEDLDLVVQEVLERRKQEAQEAAESGPKQRSIDELE